MDQLDTEHEMIEADHQGDGVYSTEIVFDQQGVYFVMYHVTVDDMHAMNKQEVVVK